jgi:hypothetical protein
MVYRSDNLSQVTFDENQLRRENHELRKRNTSLEKKLVRQKRYEMIKELIIRRPIMIIIPIVVIFMYIVGMGYSHTYLSKHYKSENVVDIYTLFWPFTMGYVLSKHAFSDNPKEQLEKQSTKQLVVGRSASRQLAALRFLHKNEKTTLWNMIEFLQKELEKCRSKGYTPPCDPKCSGEELCCEAYRVLQDIKALKESVKMDITLHEKIGSDR